MNWKIFQNNFGFSIFRIIVEEKLEPYYIKINDEYKKNYREYKLISFYGPFFSFSIRK